MKRNASLLLMMFFGFTACKKSVNPSNNNPGSTSIISESSVPTAVITSFNISFSSSTEREWRFNDNDNSYTCQFNDDDKREEAKFDDNGHESSHNIICVDGAVPAIVLNTFTQSFPNDIVYEWKLNNDGTWKAHFLRNGVKWEVTVNTAGNILKTEHD